MYKNGVRRNLCWGIALSAGDKCPGFVSLPSPVYFLLHLHDIWSSCSKLEVDCIISENCILKSAASFSRKALASIFITGGSATTPRMDSNYKLEELIVFSTATQPQNVKSCGFFFFCSQVPHV